MCSVVSAEPCAVETAGRDAGCWEQVAGWEAAVRDSGPLSLTVQPLHDESWRCAL